MTFSPNDSLTLDIAYVEGLQALRTSYRVGITDLCIFFTLTSWTPCPEAQTYRIE